MSSSLRVVTAFLNDSALPEEVKQALRDALLVEANGGSSTDLERVIDKFVEENSK